MTQRMAACLLVVLAGCGTRAGAQAPPEVPADEAGEGDTTLGASSTIGWGCPVAPFRRAHCDPAQEVEGEDPAGCYFFTRRDGAGAGWNPARSNGRYSLVGRWTGESMTHLDWLGQQGLSACEGVDGVRAFPVFEVTSFCLHPEDVERHLALLDELGAERSDRVEDRDWLRAHRCP
jgi:hypothetical protein